MAATAPDGYFEIISLPIALQFALSMSFNGQITTSF